METSLVAPRSFARQPLSALTIVTIVGLVGTSLALAYLQVMLIGMLIPPLTIFAVVSLVLAAVTAVGWRWVPALGAAWLAFLIFGNLEPMMYNLSHPAEAHSFGFNVVAIALMLGGIVSGIAATFQNYRNRPAERHTPRLLPVSLIAAVAIVLGMLVTANIPQQGVLTSISPEALSAFPSFVAKDFQFQQNEIRAKVGETVALRLMSADLEGHSLDIDELDVHALIPTDKEGLAIFKPMQPGTYTFYCAPHYNKATGEGMKGTLIVEQ